MVVAEKDEVWVPLSGDVASLPESTVATTLVDAYGTRATYFSDYLARVLLTYEPFCVRWWKSQKVKDEAVYESFVSSLELSLLRAREARNETPEDLLLRLKELPRAHLAVAFSFIDNSLQPTTLIQTLVQGVDRRISSVKVVSGGAGYIDESTLPVVTDDGKIVGNATVQDGYVTSVEIADESTPPDRQLSVRGSCTFPAILAVDKTERIPLNVLPRGQFFAPGPPGFDATPELARNGKFKPPSDLYSSTIFDGTIAPFIERTEEPSTTQYVEIALCGAACASSAHLFLTPIEMLKTRRQLLGGGTTAPPLQVEEYMSGADCVAVGHFFAGACGFGITAYLKSRSVAVAAASLIAAVASTIVVSPFESARVKCMAEPQRRLNLLDAWKEAIEEKSGDASNALFGALDALLLKDLAFAVVKFSAFDAVSNYLYVTYPFFKTSFSASLVASLLAGTVAGVLAAVVSQPADAAFTRLEAPGGDEEGDDDNVFAALAAVYKDDGVKDGLYAGTLERAVFAGVLIALEFVIFEALKDLFHLSKDDFNYALDVLASAAGNLPPPTPFK